MSVQFGRWTADGKRLETGSLQRMKDLLAPYGTEPVTAYSTEQIELLHCGLPATPESRVEVQPSISPGGALLLWDGRLDNREDLFSQLELGGSISATSDGAIVAAAYARWETECFAKLMGDWAVSIWDPKRRHLLLAKDVIGTRPLYYYPLAGRELFWSSILEPLVLLGGSSFCLDEEYVAGLLGFFPATHLTPYLGVSAVPPSCYVHIRDGHAVTRKYWEFDSLRRIRYRTDGEYEEHFRGVFQESVRRRLRTHQPILAELSGGIDSSSIVCMADTILASGDTQTPKVETLSYYVDDEPNWNEQPYFEKVEQRRGQAGTHIKVSSEELFSFDYDFERFAASPAAPGCASSRSRAVAACLQKSGSRVVLSGIGGDELLGGIPTPVPQLADYLLSAQFVTFGRQLSLWALAMRMPLLQLARGTIASFLPSWIVGHRNDRKAPDWLNTRFSRRHQKALLGYPKQLEIGQPTPSFQEKLTALEGVRRQTLDHRAFLYTAA